MTTTLSQTRPETRKPRLPGSVSLLAIVPTGLVIDQVFHASSVGIGATAALIALAWCASFGASTRWYPESWLAVGTATALAVWLSIRTSPWVDAPIVMTCVLLIVSAPVVKSMESLVSRRRLHWAMSVMEGIEAGALAVPLPFKDTQARGQRWSARLGFGRVTAWGVLLSICTGLALTLVLATGDPVFASFVRSPGTGNAPAHLVIAFMGATGAAWLAVAAIQPRPSVRGWP